MEFKLDICAQQTVPGYDAAGGQKHTRAPRVLFNGSLFFTHIQD